MPVPLVDPPAVHVKSPYLVPFDGDFRVDGASTQPPKGHVKGEAKRRLSQVIARLSELQHLLYAHDHHALLLVFQAMDAAGKDGTIQAVMSGVNPAGCQVYSFKKPSAEDLAHDFLWRTARRLPERGRIGIFNRSYYEEVLVVRVHPGYLAGQRLPGLDRAHVWAERYQSIRDHEAHLARNGTVILKFWLNVSRAEQRARFLARLDEPEKNWKFAAGDVEERAHWGAYMEAYEDALNATSRPWAPWLAIPADSKSHMRLVVAEAIVTALEGLDLRFPTVRDADRRHFDTLRRHLETESPADGT